MLVCSTKLLQAYPHANGATIAYFAFGDSSELQQQLGPKEGPIAVKAGLQDSSWSVGSNLRLWTLRALVLMRHAMVR